MHLGTLRRLFDLSWPLIGLNVLAILALVVDTAMIGRLPHSELALTGLGFATQLIFLLMVAMIGLTVGTVAFVSRAHGVKDEARVNHILAQSTQLTVGLGLTVAVVGNLLAPSLVRLLGASDAALVPALEYLRPMLAGAGVSYLAILYAAVLRGVGDTRLAFAVALVTNGLNVVFNYGLILGNWGLPSLGVLGAGVGTVASQGVGVVVMVVLLRGGVVAGVRARVRPARVDGPLARDLVRIGWPAALDMLVLNAAFLSIVGMLGRIDEVAVAAHGIGLRVQALAFVPGMSISQATGALVGSALGAGDVAEARRVLRASVVLCTVIMSTLAALIYGGATSIVTLFDVAPASALGGYTVQWIQLLGVCMPVVGVYIALVGVFHGSGATRTSLRINLWATVAFQIPASFVLGFPLALGTWGVWVAFPLAFVLKALLGTVAYRRGRWAQVGASV